MITHEDGIKIKLLKKGHYSDFATGNKMGTKTNLTLVQNGQLYKDQNKGRKLEITSKVSDMPTGKYQETSYSRINSIFHRTFKTNLICFFIL